MKENIKTIYLEDLTKITDNKFIEENVGWCNHGDPIVSFTNGKVNNWYYYVQDSDDYKDLIFDEVRFGGTHSFSGTDYMHFFYLNKKQLFFTYVQIQFAPTIEEMKKERIERCKIVINSVEDKINNVESYIVDYLSDLNNTKNELLGVINKLEAI